MAERMKCAECKAHKQHNNAAIDMDAASKYTVRYKGYSIVLKQDFGNRWHLIDGMPCAWGYIVTRADCDIMPGATWFQTVKDARLAIDALIAAKGDGDTFWRLLRKTQNRIAAVAQEVTDRAQAQKSAGIKP